MHERSCNNIRKQLRKSRHSFILFGSRRYGTATEKSDWDFFAQDNPAVAKELTDLNFAYHGGWDMYNDCQMVSHYRHRIHPIDVVLVRNFDVKKKALDISLELKELFTKDIGDFALSTMWNTLYTLVKAYPDKPLPELVHMALNAFNRDGLVSDVLKELFSDRL